MADSESARGSQRPTQRLVSTFADDPEMRELVDFFIEDLSRRVDLISEALNALDARRLRAIAHQLSGAAGGYGFAPIGDAARALEHEIDDDKHGHLFDGIEDEATISAVREKAEELISTCRRALGGDRTTN